MDRQLDGKLEHCDSKNRIRREFGRPCRGDFPEKPEGGIGVEARLNLGYSLGRAGVLNSLKAAIELPPVASVY